MSAVSMPDRSYAQRIEALDRANAVRSHRSRLKRELKAGRVTAWEVLTSGDPLVASMRVWDLLLAIPKVGRTKARATLARVRMSPSKTVGAITERQLRELARCLPRQGRPRAVLDLAADRI